MIETKREEVFETPSVVEAPEMNEQIEDLFYYVRTNDIEKVKELLENEESINNINVKDENNNTLLHFACANNHSDMILFLLCECSIHYNEKNSSGNTPLLWAIQNKNYEAVQNILSFDYYLNKNEYLQMEKKNTVYQNMLEPQRDSFKENYKLSDLGKQKIGIINIYNIHENREENKENMKKLHIYKEHNKIHLFEKNVYNKDILSEAFNAENENILHLILSHPMSNALDNQNTQTLPNGNLKMKCDMKDNEEKETQQKEEDIDIVENYDRENRDDEDSENESLNGNMTTDLEKANIIQEDIRELLINKNIKCNDENIIIKIREIGLNYYGDCLDDKEQKIDLTGIIIWEGCLLASKWISDLCLSNYFVDKKRVLEIGSGTGLASISLFLYSSYANRYDALEQLVISDINSFALDNIQYNIKLNKNLLDFVDPNWKKKISVCNINWCDENTYLKNEKNEIIHYDCIIGSDLIYEIGVVDSLIHLITTVLKKNGVFLYVCKKRRSGVDYFYEQLKLNNFHVQYEPLKEEYFENIFLNMDRDLFDMKFSEMSDREFIITTCRKI